VLLISSSRNNENWIIPGGGIEDNENPEHAAEREVYEEAGVQGRLGRLLGVFEVYEVYLHLKLVFYFESVVKKNNMR
jgi:diphosphoinositol-polyphosphate diphosphatase